MQYNQGNGMRGAAGLTVAAAFTLFSGLTLAAGAGDKGDDELQEVVVTGSLIPQTKLETATPVTVITSVQIEEHGFTSVAEALQRGSFSTGAVQGPQYTGGFTPGVQSLSMFGLSPSYTKYLIDGRPVAEYPALYNGTDIIFNMNGIPALLIDAVDILPGAQSSIYGSDAIAGVVNIRMKKKLDGLMLDGRYSWQGRGGGSDRRFGIADSFEFGPVTVTVGGQYENKNPTWGYQRDLDSNYYNQGISPAIAARNLLLLSGSDGSTYYFGDPANCENMRGLFGGTTTKNTRANHGDYCGSRSTGYFTLDNAEESTQGYLHASWDVTDKTQVFADVLVNHDVVRYSYGLGDYDTTFDSNSPLWYYEDANIGDFIEYQKLFAPEEVGSVNETMNKNTSNSIRATVGITGDIFNTGWKYQADFTYTENKLTEQYFAFSTSKVEAFFEPLFGPNLGFDPVGESYVYAPDYTNLYKPITPAQYASFVDPTFSYSHTEESLLRVQLTNSKLFTLPGGDAGIAVVGEGGRQGWDYQPDARYDAGDVFGITSTAGSGLRTRYAATAEVRLPVIPMVTTTLSGRWDDYKLRDNSLNKATYNIGLEFRPIDTVLFRGRYGTAFKAPTLADQFQGQSGFYTTATDYYRCAQQGYTAAAGNIQDCGQYNQSIFGTTLGNTKLHPITANVWDVGAVFQPVRGLTLNADYIHWQIRNEVNSGGALAQILSEESACQQGQLDVTSPTCVAALNAVVRAGNGQILEVDTQKVNVAFETLGVVTAGFNYHIEAGIAGAFDLGGQWTDIISHNFQQYPGDSTLNYLTNPFYSSEFKTKGNLTLDWSKGVLGGSILVERYGQTPNYASQQDPAGYAVANAGIVSPWTLVNASVRWELMPSLQLQFAVNNVFDKDPPADHSYPGTENQPYNVFNYNDYGRELMFSLSYKMGKHAK